ncbi:MAG: site-specific DNA-methyltransferase [Chloroflexota bacterium]|nr:site-specific DNA-methyltransferase [Chloroflexota bacterium]
MTAPDDVLPGAPGAPTNGRLPSAAVPPRSDGRDGRLVGAPGADLATPSCSPSPYFQDDLVTLFNADSTNLDFLQPGSVQLVVTSPPYNLGKDYGTTRDDATYHAYLDWVARWGRELQRVLEPGGRLCLNIPLDINVKFDEGGKRATHKQPVLGDFTELLVHTLGFVYNTTILWLENNVSRRTAWGSWLSASDPWVNTAAEAVLVLSRDRRRRNGRGKTSDISREDFMKWTLGIWDFHGENTRKYAHPAPFPEELPRRLIRLFSFREDVVLDPFVGSGTTCRAAKDLGRRSIGIDIDPSYCAVAAARCRPPAPAPGTSGNGR